MSRPQQRAPKGRDLDRLDRRAVIANLIARTHRTRLVSAESALLGDYVREEQRVADENRRAMAGTTQALAKHREAADAAILEAEQRAGTAETELASVRQAQGARDQRREQQAAALADQAKRAEDALARIRNADGPTEAAAIVAEYDGLSPQAARAHAAFATAADSTRARLAEQQRNHDIALAHADRRAKGWRQHAIEADERADRHLAAWRNARSRARDHAAEEQRVRGWAGHWAQHYREARHQLDRTRTAWRSARRRAQERARDAYANGTEYRTLRAEYDQHLAAVADEQIAYAGPELPF